MSDILSVDQIKAAMKLFSKEPVRYPFELELYPWEDRKYGDDFRARGYRVVVIGQVPSQ